MPEQPDQQEERQGDTVYFTAVEMLKADITTRYQDCVNDAGDLKMKSSFNEIGRETSKRVLFRHFYELFRETHHSLKNLSQENKELVEVIKAVYAHKQVAGIKPEELLGLFEQYEEVLWQEGVFKISWTDKPLKAKMGGRT
jgi:transposase